MTVGRGGIEPPTHCHRAREPHVSDPFDLDRFVAAQAGVFDDALAELRAGRKRSHWMWFVFPQLRGLGRSETARFYGIGGRAEAAAYLAHPVLGPRLREATRALLDVTGRTAHEILGTPDDLKLRSCATLFAAVDGPGSVFGELLARYYGGGADEATLRLLAAERAPEP